MTELEKKEAYDRAVTDWIVDNSLENYQRMMQARPSIDVAIEPEPMSPSEVIKREG